MSKGGLAKEDTKQEYPLTAIVLCDSYGYDKLFEPVCRAVDSEQDEQRENDDPWCLLPMCNAPLLAWTLESLAQAGVEQSFLFSSDSADAIRNYVSQTTFDKPYSTMSVTTRSTNAASPGDVMREVDALGILAPTEFLVVQAGYVGSIDLKDQVERFRARRTKDPNLVLSAIVSSALKSTEKYAVHVIDKDERLYHYEESRLFPRMKMATLPLEALPEHDVQFRSDLLNVGAVICSVDVPALFTENFDYQSFFPDFTNGILTSDLLGKTICVQQVDKFVANVTTPKSYAQISRAILERRCWPLALDENLPPEQEPYEERRALTFYGHDLDLAKNCVLETSVIGHESAIGQAARVIASILSPGVKVGPSSSVVRSYLGQDVQVGENCVIEDCIIGRGVSIGNDSSLQRTVIGPATTIGAKARLSRKRVRCEPPGEDETDTQSLGQGAKAFIMPDADLATSEQEDSDDDEFDVRNTQIGALGARLSEIRLSSSESSLSSLSRASSTTSLSTLASIPATGEPPAIAGLSALTGGADGGSQGAGASSTHDFKSECLQSLERSFEEGHTVENASIEIKTLRMASNVGLPTVRSVVVPFILDGCQDAKAVGPMLARWGGLIISLNGEQGAMVDTLVTVQNYVANERAADVRFFLMTLKALYETDVVNEDAVFEWYKSPAARSTAGDNGKKLWSGARPFVEALVDEEESDDEDDDDE